MYPDEMNLMRYFNSSARTKYIITALLLLTCSLIPLSLHAQHGNHEDELFSYDRYYLNAGMLREASKSGNVQGVIRAFMRNFSDGIYAISSGDLKKAKIKLLKARAIWPEYFGADFLLGMISEEAGDYGLAARFYKSYLIKLKALSGGEYRISEPIMRSITPYRIEDYDQAYVAVKYRLKDRGIDLSAVQPFYAIPGFIKFLLIIITLWAGYKLMSYKILPYFSRRQRIGHPPKGLWTCKKCAAFNLNILKECEKCGQKR